MPFNSPLTLPRSTEIRTVKLRAEICSKKFKSLVLDFCLLGIVLSINMSLQSHEDEHRGDVLQDSPSVWLAYFKITVQAYHLSFASSSAMLCPNILKTYQNYTTSDKFTHKILSGNVVRGRGRPEDCISDISEGCEGRTGH